MIIYYFAPVLPAFLTMCSQTYFIHFHLYGSGFFIDLILEANSQTNCLSIPEICNTFFCFSSIWAFNSDGTLTSTLWENQIDKTNLVPWTSNL